MAALGAKFLVLIDDPTATCLPVTGRTWSSDEASGNGCWRLFTGCRHCPRSLRTGGCLSSPPETHIEYEDQIEAFLEQTIPTASPYAWTRVTMLQRAVIRSSLCAAITGGFPICI